MNWFWASHVFAAMHEGDLVLLDVVRNDYLVMPRAEKSIALDPRGYGACITDDDLQAELLEAGLGAREAQGRDLERLRVEPATADLYDQIDETADIREIVALSGLSLRVAVGLRAFSLQRLVRRPDACEPGHRDTLVSSALRLRSALPWLPFQGDCFYRAALLRAYLGAKGNTARWVFGVSTWPFSAHCWIQVGDLVLNDRLQRVRRFTPILVA